MRQLVFAGTGRFSVDDVESRPLGEHEVRVRVLAAGICGSDVHGFTGANDRRQPGQVMGHEAVGEIIETVNGAEGPAIGDIVVINPVISCGACLRCSQSQQNLCEERRIVGCVPELPGAFADEVVVPTPNAIPFAGGAPAEWGSLVEPFAVGAHAASRAGSIEGRSAVIIGGGPIGLGAALAVERQAPRRLLVVEPIAHRRGLLERLGFVVVAPGNAELQGGAFEVVIECVGHAATVVDAMRLAAPAGVIVVPGLGEPSVPIPMADLVMGERTIAGTAVYTPEDFRATAEWVASGERDLGPVIEGGVELEELPGVFDGYADGSLTAFKTIFRPSDRLTAR